MSRPIALAVLITLLIGAGCGSKDNKQEEKKLATERWNRARAGVMVTMAQNQYANGDMEKARKTVDEAVRLSPDSSQARLVSARLHIEKGQLEAAERELVKARELSPNDGEPYYLSGIVMQRWQKHEQAYENYKLASERSPAELAYLLAVAESLVTLDRDSDALTLLQSKADYFEHSGTIRDAVGQLYMQQGKFLEAARSFRQAAVLSEDEPAIRERLALSLYKSGQHREATDVLTKLVTVQPFDKRGDLFAILGDCQLVLGRARDARYSFETASQLDEFDPVAWRGLGRAALETGDFTRAELSLKKSLRYDAQRPETHLLLGYLHTQTQKYEPALQSFLTASKLNPTDTFALCMVGHAYEKCGKPDMALRYYSRALQIRPSDRMAQDLMARIE